MKGEAEGYGCGGGGGTYLVWIIGISSSSEPPLSLPQTLMRKRVVRGKHAKEKEGGYPDPSPTAQKQVLLPPPCRRRSQRKGKEIAEMGSDGKKGKEEGVEIGPQPLLRRSSSFPITKFFSAISPLASSVCTYGGIPNWQGEIPFRPKQVQKPGFPSFSPFFCFTCVCAQ